ncbi:hypothetical protein GCM10010388_11540 [Streptomyces mauvecolor]
MLCHGAAERFGRRTRAEVGGSSDQGAMRKGHMSDGLSYAEFAARLAPEWRVPVATPRSPPA